MTIGEAIKRIEDPRLLVGKGQYVADLSIPGMLEAYVVRSPYAHARIHSIDSATVRAAASYKKSVITVVTAHDLPPNLRPIPMRLTPAPESGGKLTPLQHALQMPLASNIVRYVGELTRRCGYPQSPARRCAARPSHTRQQRYLYHRLKKG